MSLSDRCFTKMSVTCENRLWKGAKQSKHGSNEAIAAVQGTGAVVQTKAVEVEVVRSGQIPDIL